jgi:hypothetical protein
MLAYFTPAIKKTHSRFLNPGFVIEEQDEIGGKAGGLPPEFFLLPTRVEVCCFFIILN